MKIEIKYTPNKKQELFHSCPADEAVYGGAKGGGKSCALIMESTAYALENAGAIVYLFRETYDDLEANLIREFKDKIPKEIYTYSESKHIAKLINGSEIIFRYISNDADAEGYQGRSMDFIGVDELTKHSQKAIQVLLSCLRSPKGFRPLFRGTCNPGGKGHAWVKERYIDGTRHGEDIITDAVSGTTIAFIPAVVYDNDILMENDPAYVRRLENLPEAQRKAFLYGDWDIFDGQYFTEFDASVHICNPFPIPAHWKRVTTMDYGLDMFAHYHIAEDENGEAYFYREIYQSGLIVSDAAKQVKDIESSETGYIKRLAPPDLWNTQSISGTSTAYMFENNGLNLTKANNDRIDGWLALKELLKVWVDESGKKRSKLHIFKTCPNLIRCLPLAQYSEKVPCDVANEPHEITHSCDALRYYAISYRGKANPIETKREGVEWSKDQWDDYYRASREQKDLMIKMWGYPKK